MSTVKWRERKQWAAARNLDDLGQLMARWLEGDLRSRPGYYGSTDLDSGDLTALCANLCRAGIVTHQSQCGGLEEIDGSPGRARIFIEAFSDDANLTRLQRTCDKAGLTLLAQRTPVRRWFGSRQTVDSVPVVEWGGRTRLSLDLPIDRSYVGVIWEGVSDEAFGAVLNSWQVAITDPVWGRNDHLIRALGSVCGSAVSR